MTGGPHRRRSSGGVRTQFPIGCGQDQRLQRSKERTSLEAGGAVRGGVVLVLLAAHVNGVGQSQGKVEAWFWLGGARLVSARGDTLIAAGEVGHQPGCSAPSPAAGRVRSHRIKVGAPARRQIICRVIGTVSMDTARLTRHGSRLCTSSQWLQASLLRSRILLESPGGSEEQRLDTYRDMTTESLPVHRVALKTYASGQRYGPRRTHVDIPTRIVCSSV